ncbi:MAG: YdcF family protein, partial [Clostridia bacterium]|nr:YdcF family protein [Clostridia bacterium]
LVYPAAHGVRYDEDAVVILGAGLKENGVTPQLAERLDTGIEYYKRNPDAVIVVSGGKGSDERLSEAEAMEEYLVSRGIPQSVIIKEDRSVSTYTNFCNVKQILDSYFEREYKVAVVTSRYHMLRAGVTAKYVGLDINCLCAGTPPLEIPLRYLREFFALIAYLFCMLFGIL